MLTLSLFIQPPQILTYMHTYIQVCGAGISLEADDGLIVAYIFLRTYTYTYIHRYVVQAFPLKPTMA